MEAIKVSFKVLSRHEAEGTEEIHEEFGSTGTLQINKSRALSPELTRLKHLRRYLSHNST
jgi:hypothetical protein